MLILVGKYCYIYLVFWTKRKITACINIQKRKVISNHLFATNDNENHIFSNLKY